jgi:hypothetical protein
MLKNRKYIKKGEAPRGALKTEKSVKMEHTPIFHWKISKFIPDQ